jgi:hypothetical protein
VSQVVLIHFRYNEQRFITEKKHCKEPPLQQETADHAVILVPGSLDVILLVDKQETAG